MGRLAELWELTVKEVKWSVTTYFKPIKLVWNFLLEEHSEPRRKACVPHLTEAEIKLSLAGKLDKDRAEHISTCDTCTHMVNRALYLSFMSWGSEQRVVDDLEDYHST